MRKSILLFILLLIISFNLFSSDSVCVIPYNSQITDYIKAFFPDNEIKTVDNLGNISTDALISSDRRLFEYIQRNTGANIIVIPLLENISGFKHKSISIFKNNVLTKVYESIDDKDVSFSPEVMLNLVPYITDKRLGLLHINNKEPGTVVYVDSKPVGLYLDYLMLEEGKHSIYFSTLLSVTDKYIFDIKMQDIHNVSMDYDVPQFHNLLVDSSVTAEVFNNGKSLGFTPLKVDSYSLPMILRFHAEGYSDRVIYVSEPVDTVNVNLNVIEMADADVFKKRQSNFYKSFIRSLLIYGSISALRGSVILNSENQYNTERILSVGLAASLADLGYDLFKYYQTVKNIAP